MTQFSFSKKIKGLSLFLLLFSVLFTAGDAFATFISPPRVLIDSNKTSAEMLIMNQDQDTKVYTFDWQDRAMTPDGDIMTGEDAKALDGYRPASPYLIYSPRKVVVGPGETQRVRIYVKRKGLTEGEYRSHILISGKPVKENEKPEIKEGLGGSIAVIPQAGIPVMVRHGRTKVEIEPIDISLLKEDGAYYLNAKFTNNSTRTIYAQTKLICELAGQEEPKIIQVKTLRMYHEYKNIDRKLQIRSGDFDPAQCQSINLEMTDRSDFEYSKKPFYSQKLK